MKKILVIILVLAGWFALVSQFILMIENRATPLPETIIRFFSFFTILTNLMVVIYFSKLLLQKKYKPTFSLKRNNELTALTVYILIVCIVYQVVLRPLWQPEGLQKVVDELLHTLIPAVVLVFWCLYQDFGRLKWASIFPWLLYPLAYLGYILLRGKISGFYPYPFVDVAHLGIQKVLMNSSFLLLFFILLAALLIGIGKLMLSKK